MKTLIYAAPAVKREMHEYDLSTDCYTLVQIRSQVFKYIFVQISMPYFLLL